MNYHKYLTLFYRIILGMVFIYASVDKISHPYQFRIIIENYQLVPLVLSHYTAMFLPWLELICGILLIAGIYVKTSAGLLGSLLVVFILALVSALVRGLDINCGCFTVNAQDSTVSVFQLLEDFLLLAMALYLIYFYKPFFGRPKL